MATDLLEYFGSIDISILELFGMSETTGPSCCNTQSDFRIGTCGFPLPGTRVACDQNTGEVKFCGRHVMMGYMHDLEATSEIIDPTGWLRSGDVGKIDEDGYLKITGRKKEILITTGGENVAPVLIEDALKKHLSCISNAMVVGDKRKFLTVLLCLKTEMNDDGTPTDKLTKASRLNGCSTVREACNSSAYIAMLDQGLKAANEAAISRAQHVQKFAVLPCDFTLDGGELTPTMKVKRNAVLMKYADIIAGLYS